MKEISNQAIEALNVFEESDSKKALILLTIFVKKTSIFASKKQLDQEPFPC